MNDLAHRRHKSPHDACPCHISNRSRDHHRDSQRKAGDIELPQLVGPLKLNESLATKSIVIPDAAIGRGKIWREIADLIRNPKQTLHLKEICEHIGTTDASHAAYHIRRAQAVGLIKKIGHQGGWVAHRSQ